MPRFIELTNHYDAFEQFANELNRARKPLRFANREAFRAFTRSRELLKKSEFVADWHNGEGNQSKANQLQNAAFAEDVQAEIFASIVVLSVDDILKRFYNRLFGRPPLLEKGFGRKHNAVPLTTMLQAGANAIRHVSWWADNLEYPYPDNGLTRDEKMALANIRILEKAFGSFGGPWNRPPSWDIVVTMNTHDVGPVREEYENVELDIIGAALSIANEHSEEARGKLVAVVGNGSE